MSIKVFRVTSSDDILDQWEYIKESVNSAPIGINFDSEDVELVDSLYYQIKKFVFESGLLIGEVNSHHKDVGKYSVYVWNKRSVGVHAYLSLVLRTSILDRGGLENEF